MLANGQAAVIRMAIRDLNDPLVDRYEPAVLLGAMRADVWYVPLVGKVIEHLSFSHFYRRRMPGGFLPFITRGTRTMARTWFGEAIDAHRAGNHAAAFVRLGEVSHLIADMSCPVHVHRVIHESDPFEWYVEAHHEELRSLPLPTIEGRSAEDLIDSMASVTRTFEPDRTNYSIGRMLRRAGLRKSVPRSVIAEQARQLIPLAAAHTAAMLRFFLCSTAKSH
ncbi:MAG TPA: zinc dependent phospholipase C family protein [Thermoanaerobaculia bacterium]